MVTYKEHKTAAKYRTPLDTYTLTEDEYKSLTNLPCVYCGNPAPNRIDRVDPRIGFTSENSVACCLRCDCRKGNFEYLGVEEAIRQTKALAHRNEIPPASKREWRKGLIPDASPSPKKPKKPSEIDEWEQRKLARYAERA